MSTGRGERQSQGTVRLAAGPVGAPGAPGAPGAASVRGGRFPDALGTAGALGDALAPVSAAGAALADDALGGPLAGTDTLGAGLSDGDALGGVDATGGAFNAMAHRDRPLGDSLGGGVGGDALRGPVGGAVGGTVEDIDATAMALPALSADVLAFDGASLAGSIDPLSHTDGPVRTHRGRGIAAATTEVPAQAPTVPTQEPPQRSRPGKRKRQRQSGNRSQQPGTPQRANRPRQSGSQQGRTRSQSTGKRPQQTGSRPGPAQRQPAPPAFPPPSGPPAPMPPASTVATPGTAPWQGHQPRHAAGPRRSRPGQKPIRTGRLIIGLIVLALFMSNVIQSCVRTNAHRFGGTPAPTPAVTSTR